MPRLSTSFSLTNGQSFVFDRMLEELSISRSELNRRAVVRYLEQYTVEEFKVIEFSNE